MTAKGQQSVRRSLSVLGAGALLIVLLGSFALVLVQHNRDAKDDLRSRFQTRATLTARFVRKYIENFEADEREQGQRLLGGLTVNLTTFAQVAQSMNFDAGGVLDRDGSLLAVWPPKPELLGTNMAARYAHLNQAIHGQVGISGVVLSAARRVPVVAVAVPYQTPAGLRVLSGAFSARDTPLGAYFQDVAPIHGSRAFLLDSNGEPIDSGRTPGRGGSGLTLRAVGRLHRPSGELTDAGVTYAVAPVTGTPWHVVLTAPSAALYGPLGTPWGPWLLFVAFAVSGVSGVVLLARLGRARAAAVSLARTDVLTGLPNRRAVDEAYVRLAAHATRNGKRLAVLSIDLDYFKQINDTYGHRVGDQALTATGEALRAAVRTEDIVGRWGGEEFLVILADATTPGTLRAGERLREAITDGAARAQIPGRLTASVGAAIDNPTDLESLLRSADRALYAAKEAGRDRLHLATATMPAPRAAGVRAASFSAR